MPATAETGLVRAIGRWSLAALMINSIVGSGIFGLPSVVARLVGPASPWAVLLAGVCVGIIMACFAEVASYFREAGGPYLYARTVFGRLAGIETGWILWLARLTASAAGANLFIIYVTEFWPQAKEPVWRLIILTALIGLLTWINLRGVRGGARVSDVFTIAKLVPLCLVAVAGLFYLFAHGLVTPEPGDLPAHASWLKAILLLVFAYGGFESALSPMSEAKDPQRDAAFALFTALATCTVLYAALQWSVVGIVPDSGHSERPLADVATRVLGHGGGRLIAVGALISVYGYLSANILAVPRITFALSEQRDFPRIFSAIHPRFRTPYVSILVYAGLVWLLALLGSFAWNVTLSAVARLFYYGLGCAALPVLRARRPGAAKFRLPGGTVFAIAGVAICLALATQVALSGFVILFATVLVGLCNWAWVRKRAAS